MKKILLLALVAFTLQAHSQDTIVPPAYTVQPFNSDPVTINIPPVKIGNSIIMRKARVQAMIFNQKYKTVSVSCEILPYAFEGTNFTDTAWNDNSNYGELISDMPVRGLEIVATNSTFVNPATGEVLDNPTGTVMGQYDFFFMVATYQPVKVNELIQQYLMQNKNWK